MSLPPSIADAPARLIRLLETGEFILFVGAGVGIEAGFGDWKKALLEIADRLEAFDRGYGGLLRAEAQASHFLQAAELPVFGADNQQ